MYWAFNKYLKLKGIVQISWFDLMSIFSQFFSLLRSSTFLLPPYDLFCWLYGFVALKNIRYPYIKIALKRMINSNVNVFKDNQGYLVSL